MRVVWVTPAVPHPAAAGGWANEYELIAALAQRHDIEVVSAGTDTQLGPGPLLDSGAKFRRVAWTPEPYPSTRPRLAAAILRADPSLVVWLKRSRIDALAGAIADIGAATPIDVVHVTQQELAPLAARVDAPVGLLLYDSLTREIDTRRARERLVRRKLQLRVERRRSLRFERRWYPEADGLAAVSAVDAAWVRQETGVDAEVIEVAVPDRFFDRPDRVRSTTDVAFVGSLDHHPNQDAIEWLATDIWPSVSARRPDARLVVVGRDDPAGSVSRRLRPVVEQAGGCLHVDVADVRPYYWDAAVVVAPMRVGGGMKTKVVHAIAAGAPLVSSPLGLEGLDAAARERVSTASSAEQFASAIVDLLDRPEAATARARSAADAVRPLAASSHARTLEYWWEGLVS